MSESGTELVRQDSWDNFPAGLKVLVVDDDPLCLKVVERMLRQCNYTVTTCANGECALEKLRDKSHHYDLVLSDVYMPDMDGFKLLEHIGLELDLPVIMMSSNGETSVVLRGVTHGAVDFLIKPVRVEELRNVWQHVVRRRRDQARDTKESDEEGTEDGRRSDKKRKECDSGPARRDSDDGNTAKKPRVVWSVEMHQQFVNAVNQLGIDKAVPKRILDLMNVEGLTRENVASHLQKYRLYLKRVSGVHPGATRGKGGAAAKPGVPDPTFAALLGPGLGAGGGSGPLALPQAPGLPPGLLGGHGGHALPGLGLPGHPPEFMAMQLQHMGLAPGLGGPGAGGQGLGALGLGPVGPRGGEYSGLGAGVAPGAAGGGGGLAGGGGGLAGLPLGSNSSENLAAMHAMGGHLPGGRHASPYGVGLQGSMLEPDLGLMYGTAQTAGPAAGPGAPLQQGYRFEPADDMLQYRQQLLLQQQQAQQAQHACVGAGGLPQPGAGSSQGLSIKNEGGMDDILNLFMHE